MSTTHEHGGNVFATARSLGIPPEQIVDFSASINPLGLAPGVRDALAGCLERLLHYPDKDATELKDCLATYHGVSPAQLTVANGSTELIHLMPRLAGGSRALIVAPAFAEYASALEKSGWQTDYFTLQSGDDFSLSLPALQQKLKGRYDLLFVCNPGNPTGALILKSDIAQLLELCRESGTFLVLDEAFIDFCEEESAKDLIGGFDRAVLLRSMTKFFAIPGLRLGYAIGARETIEGIAALKHPWSVNTAAQVAGIASLSDPAYHQATRSYVEEERRRLSIGLAALPSLTVFPARANYLLVQLGNGITAAELRSRLLGKGIMIRDCGNFQGLDGSFFRVAVRLREENDRLLELLGESCG
jgi:threonine-phosphate decarboxylase